MGFRSKHTQRHPSTINYSLFLTSTGNSIGDRGATTLSESLKSNTTLTELYLSREDIRHRKDVHQQITLFLSHHINREQDWRHRYNIIEWIVEIKHNTHETQSVLWKRKKTHKWHTSIIHSFPILFTSTDNKIEGKGATSLSEALKSNTTLTELILSGGDKRHTRRSPVNHSFPFSSHQQTMRLETQE